MLTASFPRFWKNHPLCRKKLICHIKGLDFSQRWSKKNQNGRLKKTSFSSSANSQYFFMKISWIVPWGSRIDWCGSTYMVLRLSDIRSKTSKKCIFCVFRPFWEHMSDSLTVVKTFQAATTNTWKLFDHRFLLQNIFVKISWIGPWVSRTEWCEGHWCGIYGREAVQNKLKKGLKTQKMPFCLFLSLCRTASWPYRLSHINGLPINQFY